MFGFLKKKDEKTRLERRYRELLEASHALSTTNRRASDLKRAEAEEVLQRLLQLTGER